MCQWIWENTGLDFLARNSDEALAIIAHVGLIVVLAIVIRAVLFRAINRMTRITVDGSTPALLQPLRTHAERALRFGLSAERRRQRALAIGSLLKSVSSFVIIGTAVILILAEFGINIAPLIASAGLAAAALAFGAQNLIKDFLSGIFMTLEDQYGVGDSVDLGLATGTVITVGLRTTAVRADDGTIWYVRNGEVLRVGNTSQGDDVVNIDIPLPYAADTRKAGEIALAQTEAVAASEDFAEALIHAPRLLGIVDVAPGVVTIRITATVRAGDQAAFTRAVRAAIKDAYDAARAQDPDTDFRPPTPPTGP